MKAANNHRGLRLDQLNKKLMGVCAGIARFYDWNAQLVRIVAVVCFFMSPVFITLSYLAACLVMPKRIK